METADPGASWAAQRAVERRPGRERDDAIAECVATVWATRVFNLETGDDSVALRSPNIHWAILRVRCDRRIAGRAWGIEVFDDRANRKRQQLLIMGSDGRVARSGPTTPTREARVADASVDHTEARSIAGSARMIASSAALGIARGGQVKCASGIGPTRGRRYGSATNSA
jgi:hypothetical protein